MTPDKEAAKMPDQDGGKKGMFDTCVHGTKWGHCKSGCPKTHVTQDGGKLAVPTHILIGDRWGVKMAEAGAFFDVLDGDIARLLCGQINAAVSRLLTAERKRVLEIPREALEAYGRKEISAEACLVALNLCICPVPVTEKDMEFARCNLSRLEGEGKIA